MAKHLTTIADLRMYLEGVLERAGDHRQNSRDVILTLAGYLFITADPNPGIMATGNVLWAHFHGRRHVFTYGHDQGSGVVIRRDSTHGRMVAALDNRTTTAQVKAILASL
jgi:hypothetical protein